MNDFDTTQHFDEDKARAYDRVIRQVVPGYETLHHMIKVLLTRYVTETNANFLSVGCGTGVELTQLGQDFPNWTFTGVEPAPAMAEVARANVTLQHLNERCQVVEGYVEDLPIDEVFDGASLILVMHFVPDDGTKEALLRSIFDRLKPGAPLVVADLFGEPSSDRLSRFMEVWADWQRFNGMPDHIVERGFEHVVRDIQFVPEDRILELLETTGFENVERFYGALLFGGWIAWKG